MVSSLWLVFWWPWHTVINTSTGLGCDLNVIVVLSSLLGCDRHLVTYFSSATVSMDIGVGRKVISEMGIDLDHVERDVRLVDLLFGTSPRRRIAATYQIVEPLEDAEEKLKAWSQELPHPWHIVEDGGSTTLDGSLISVRAACDPFEPLSGAGIQFLAIAEDSTLRMVIRFANSPHWCGLPTNMVNRWVRPDIAEQKQSHGFVDEKSSWPTLHRAILQRSHRLCVRSQRLHLLTNTFVDKVRSVS